MTGERLWERPEEQPDLPRSCPGCGGSWEGFVYDRDGETFRCSGCGSAIPLPDTACDVLARIEELEGKA